MTREKPILFSAPMVRAILDGRKTQTRRVLNLARAVGEPVAPPGHVLELIYPGSRQHYGYITPEHERPSWRVQRLCDVDCKHVDDVGPYDGRHCFAWGPMPYAPGQRLWVRETWWRGRWTEEHHYNDIDGVSRSSVNWCYHKPGDAESIAYAADGDPPGGRTPAIGDHPLCEGWDKMPSIFLPRLDSRITLEVTEVRVQRLQEISEDDAQAEGVDLGGHPHHRSAFSELWDSINGKPRPMLDDDGEPVLDDNDRPRMVASRSWASNPWVFALTFRRLP